MDQSGPGPAFRLDGAARANVAEELWRKWWMEGRGVALLFGFPGVGKSDRVVWPLCQWAASQGVPVAWVDVPVNTLDADRGLAARIVDEVEGSGHAALSSTVAGDASFADTLRPLLRAGALIVVDEFQRMLGPQGRPSSSMVETLEQLARRPADKGCLILVTNRHVDWSWTRQFDVTELLPPEDADAISIVLEHLDGKEADARFTHGRRLEVVRRLGRNPEVLRLLGLLLKTYVLDDLLPPTGDVPGEPFDPRLVENIERDLLARAAKGLVEPARAFLRDMSVIRDWAAWDLVESMARGRGDVRELVRETRERYLLRCCGSAKQPATDRGGGRYQAHPLVREADVVYLRRDEDAWRAAHLRAGGWYAQKLKAAGRVAVHDRTLTLGLDGAWYHYNAADAEEDLLTAIEPARRYIEHHYGMTAASVRSAGERDARIALLEPYTSRWGTPGTHYHLATLLRDRGRPEDLRQALTHAKHATAGQDHSAPWVLWVKLVRAVDGPKAAGAAAREAISNVSPSKALFSLYQLLGCYLAEIGQAGEAVAALRRGTEHVTASAARLSLLAVQIAAGEPTDGLLREVWAWLQKPDANCTLAKTLLLEREGRWDQAVSLIAEGRQRHPLYVPLVVHEALCQLALDDAAAAQSALDRFPKILRFERSSVITWCASFVALKLGDVPRAAELLSIYLGIDVSTSAPGQIRARLLCEWDTVVARPGSPIPSLVIPIMPPTLSGLPAITIRSQYGGPVLPQHQAIVDVPDTERRLRILAIATEWFSARGGVSTFNRRLCSSLAAWAQVTCLVLRATDEERQNAAAGKVTLIEAPEAPGASDADRLSYPPSSLKDAPPDIIIGHGRWTGPAAHRMVVDFPHAKVLHILHVIPDDIERFKDEREVDAAVLAEERQEVELALSAAAHRVVAVGPRIYEWFLHDLEARGISPDKVIRFDPGFDPGAARDRPPLGRLTVLMVGRTEDYRLKGLDLAARAFNQVRQRRRHGKPRIHLLVRGAPPEASTDLKNKMCEWAGDASLPVQVRPYSTKEERLSADCRRRVNTDPQATAEC